MSQEWNMPAHVLSRSPAQWLWQKPNQRAQRAGVCAQCVHMALYCRQTRDSSERLGRSNLVPSRWGCEGDDESWPVTAQRCAQRSTEPGGVERLGVTVMAW